MSSVGSSRIRGYWKTEPRTVKPAMASTDARARAAPAKRWVRTSGCGVVRGLRRGWVDVLDELAGGAGIGDRKVPDATRRAGGGAEGEEAGRHVGGVGVAVRLVRV